MNNEAVKVNQIDFRTAVPSLRLFDSLTLAFSLQCLVPALLGVLLLDAMDRFLPTANPEAVIETFDFAESLTSAGEPYSLFITPIQTVRHIVVVGFLKSSRELFRLAMLLLVPGFVGTSISRAAGLRFCADRRSGVVRSLRHSARLWKSVLSSILLMGVISLAMIACFWITLGLTRIVFGPDGWCGISGAPAWLAAFVLMSGGTILMTGWLLSLAAIGVDSCDGAESLSRGISYVLSHVRRTIFYAVVLGLLIWISSEGIRFLFVTSSCLTAAAPIESLSVGELSGETVCGSGFSSFLKIAIRTWAASLFFCGMTTIYVMHRQLEDGVPLSEVDSAKGLRDSTGATNAVA